MPGDAILPVVEDAAPALLLRLGEEELRYLLRAMGVPGVAWLADEDPSLTERERVLLLRAAERSLQARGLLAFTADDPSPTITQDVVALIGAYVTAQRITVVRREVLGREPEIMFYASNPSLTVEHLVPEAGVHQLLAVADPHIATRRVLYRIGLTEILPDAEQEQASTPAFAVQESVLEASRDQAHNAGDVPGAAALLVRAGVPTESAVAIAESFGRLTAVTSMGSLSIGDGDADVGGVVFLQEPQSMWMLEPDGTPDPLVRCRAVSPRDVADYVEQLMMIEAATVTP